MIIWSILFVAENLIIRRLTMQNTENTDVKSNINSSNFNEAPGTGVLGSIIFIVVMMGFMIALSSWIN